MLQVLIVLGVLIVALVGGGSLSRLATLQVRKSLLVLGGLALQLLIFPLFGSSPFNSFWTVTLYLTSMALVVWWVAENRHLPGIVLIGLGVVMNLVAIAANGGYMPVDPDAAVYAGTHTVFVEGAINNNSVATDTGAILWLLTDIFPIPDGIPFAAVFSLGDILLTTGASILLYKTVNSKPEGATTEKGTTDEQRAAAT